jgi:hypothetical protein
MLQPLIQTFLKSSAKDMPLVVAVIDTATAHANLRHDMF